jgi:hypothetical protein
MVQHYESDWQPQAVALQMLGLSRTGLWRLRQAGLVRGGVHTYRTGPGSRSPLWLNVPAVRLALQCYEAARDSAP